MAKRQQRGGRARSTGRRVVRKLVSGEASLESFNRLLDEKRRMVEDVARALSR